MKPNIFAVTQAYHNITHIAKLIAMITKFTELLALHYHLA